MALGLRSLASDTFVYGFTMMLGRFLTFLLTPVYTNYLDKAQFDFQIIVFTVFAFLNIFYAFGFEQSFFRYFRYDKPDESKDVFTQSFVSVALIATLSSFAMIAFAGNIGSWLTEVEGSGEMMVWAAFVPFLDAIAVIPYCYLRAIRASKKFAIYRFITIIVAVALNFLFVVGMDMQAFGVILAQLIANLTGVALLFPIILRQFVPQFKQKLFAQMARFGIPTLPASLSAIALSLIDRPVIKAVINDPEKSVDVLTTYQVNYKLGIPMMIFVTVFEYAWKPFYLANYQKEGAKETFARVLIYFTAFSAIIFLGMEFFVDYLVRMPFIGGKFIKETYWEGMKIIPLILGAYYFNGLYTNFAAGIMIEKKTKYLPITFGVAAIANVILNIILVPGYGYVGAAWSTFLAYFIGAVIIFFISQNYTRLITIGLKYF
jgi:O-antigen/teichoic acid export membrane protein